MYISAKNTKTQRSCWAKVYQQIILVTSPIARRRQWHGDIPRAQTVTHFCSKFSELYLHITGSYTWIFIIPCKYICSIWMFKLLPSPLWTIYQNALSTTHLERKNWTEWVARELTCRAFRTQHTRNKKQTALYLWLWIRKCAFTDAPQVVCHVNSLAERMRWSGHSEKPKLIAKHERRLNGWAVTRIAFTSTSMKLAFPCSGQCNKNWFILRVICLYSRPTKIGISARPPFRLDFWWIFSSSKRTSFLLFFFRFLEGGIRTAKS